MLGWNKVIDQLAMTIIVCQYGCVKNCEGV